MASISSPTTPEKGQASWNSSFVTIEQWTDGTIDALRNLSIDSSPASVRGTSVSLSIPIDAVPIVSIAPTDKPAPAESLPIRHNADGLPVKRPELRRRDSLIRREALAKGREGSRRRQRWENGLFLSGTAWPE
jgi:hypothetical protein